MPGLVPGIHDLSPPAKKTWMAGTSASEATPFFERLCPAMTIEVAPERDLPANCMAAMLKSRRSTTASLGEAL
jgi:hypothetical protein